MKKIFIKLTCIFLLCFPVFNSSAITEINSAHNLSQKEWSQASSWKKMGKHDGFTYYFFTSSICETNEDNHNYISCALKLEDKNPDFLSGVRNCPGFAHFSFMIDTYEFDLSNQTYRFISRMFIDTAGDVIYTKTANSKWYPQDENSEIKFISKWIKKNYNCQNKL